MSQQQLEQPHQEETTDQISQEWLSELGELNPDSHQYAVLAQALGELGLTPGLNNETDESASELPPGFVSATSISSGATLPMEQFNNRIYSLRPESEAITTDVTELVTDTGFKLRVSDLRSLMSAATEKLQPKSRAEQTKLDKYFWHDMKTYAETGQSRNTVEGVKGVSYTKAGDTKMRSYWTAVKDTSNADGVRAVARFADTGDNKGLESKLYHKVFKMHL